MVRVDRVCRPVGLDVEGDEVPSYYVSHVHYVLMLLFYPNDPKVSSLRI